MTRTLWPRLIQVLLVLALPIVLLVVDVRIVTGHWFVRWEYGKADFPPDPYGLSTAERIPLAQVCVDYLATDADISLLGDLRLPDGEPAFNQRELRHMFDVQVVYGYLMTACISRRAAVGGRDRCAAGFRPHPPARSGRTCARLRSHPGIAGGGWRVHGAELGGILYHVPSHLFRGRNLDV